MIKRDNIFQTYTEALHNQLNSLGFCINFLIMTVAQKMTPVNIWWCSSCILCCIIAHVPFVLLVLQWLIPQKQLRPRCQVLNYYSFGNYVSLLSHPLLPKIPSFTSCLPTELCLCVLVEANGEEKRRRQAKTKEGLGHCAWKDHSSCSSGVSGWDVWYPLLEKKNELHNTCLQLKWAPLFQMMCWMHFS